MASKQGVNVSLHPTPDSTGHLPLKCDIGCLTTLHCFTGPPLLGSRCRSRLRSLPPVIYQLSSQARGD